MKLIVGLGNPGRKYVGTRHNIGFDVLDAVARKYGVGPARAKFDGRVLEAEFDGERALLLWPLTYMNLSGTSVGKACDFYKLETHDILVLCDDFHIPFAKLRFRARGSSGGQKGLADILRRLGTEEINRQRIGVGPVPEGWDPVGFVLGKFGKEDTRQIEEVIGRAAQGTRDWAKEGIEFCMNQYNAS